MENLLNNNALILLFWVIFSLISDKEKKTYIIVIMTYMMIYIVNLFDVVQTFPSVFICLLALFIYFELFYDSFKRKVMNNIFYKIIDFFYIMIFEYYFILFLTSIFFTTTYINILVIEMFNINIVYYVSFILISWACIRISSQHYLLCTFDEVKSKLDKVSTYKEFLDKKKRISHYLSIISIEDKNFFNRGNRYTIFNVFYLKRIIPIKNHRCNSFIKKSVFTQKKIRLMLKLMLKLIRGYSTIEMQLMRTLVIKEGYRFTIRRKFLEVIYTKLFFDSLQEYYRLNKLDLTYFKDYLLYIYVNTAKILIDDKNNVLNQIRNKILNVDEYSKEELFILTLSFSGKLKWSNVFDLYKDVISKLELNQTKLIELKNNIFEER